MNINNGDPGMVSHKCGINDIRNFLINYAMQNCKRNVVSGGGELKVTMACFTEWHEEHYGARANEHCRRSFYLYLPIVAEELGFRVLRRGYGKYVILVNV